MAKKTKAGKKRNTAKSKAAVATPEVATPAAGTPSNKSLSPLDRHYEELEAFVKLNKDILEPMMIKGVQGISDESEINADELTTEQVEVFRHVLLTQRREDELNNMRDLILGDQANSQFVQFKRSFSEDVLATWHIVKRSLNIMDDPSKKLDRLFGYSYNLWDVNIWMHFNYGNMAELVDGLARAWKSLLNTYTDEELGWDCKYTKPGMLEFLHQFKNKIKNMPKEFLLGEFNFE
jgi:hypothetical protein